MIILRYHITFPTWNLLFCITKQIQKLIGDVKSNHQVMDTAEQVPELMVCENVANMTGEMILMADGMVNIADGLVNIDRLIDSSTTMLMERNDEAIEIESITEEVVTEDVVTEEVFTEEMNHEVEAEKAKGPRYPSPGKIYLTNWVA